jgi:glucose dehydrogenase
MRIAHKPVLEQRTEAAAGTSLTGATFNRSPGDPPGEWRSQERDYANTRYGDLDQINVSNASRLRIAWTSLSRWRARFGSG